MEPEDGSGDESLAAELAAAAEGADIEALREELAATRKDLRELAGVVAEMAAKILAAPTPGRTWLWSSFNQQEHNEAVAKLRAWMQENLVRYPAVVDKLRPCWPSHSMALDALTAAYQTWTLAMGAKSSGELWAFWMDRWRKALLEQLDEALGGCRREHVPDDINLENLG